VDVGSGTGRFAVACSRLGYDVLAVEPDEGMRAVAEAALPGRTAAGAGEVIPVPDASADAVTAAQAYHWFEPEPAHAEFARVLRRGGHVGLIWNFRDDREPWVRDLFELIGGEDRLTDVGAAYAPDLGPAFAPTEAGSWSHEQLLSLEEFMGLVASYSYVRLRADRDEVMASVRDLATSHPDLGGGPIRLPYVTKAYRAQVLRS
jgi:SAM-dependent methyltransferase